MAFLSTNFNSPSLNPMSCITGAPLLKPSPSLQFSIPGPPAICTLQVILFFSLCTARNSSFPICLIASVLLFPAPLTAIVPPFLVPRNQGRIFFISCSSSLFSSISCVHHSLHFLHFLSFLQLMCFCYRSHPSRSLFYSIFCPLTACYILMADLLPLPVPL